MRAIATPLARVEASRHRALPYSAEAFAEAVEPFRRGLRNYATSIVGAAEAEDVVQVALRNAYSAGTLDLRRPGPYLRSAVKHEAVRVSKARQRRREQPLEE